MTHTYTVFAIDSTGGTAQFVRTTPDKRFWLGRLTGEMESACILLSRVERGAITLDLPARAIVVVVPNSRNDASRPLRCHTMTVNLN